MITRVIGIDLGVTAEHQAVVLDPASGEYLGKPWKFKATPEALERLIARAQQGITETVRTIAVLEATEMMWYPVGVYLHDQGVEVYRITGRQTQALRRALWAHASSDRIDCRVIAKVYTTAAEQLVRWWPPSGEQLALQRLCREYARWRELSVAIQNRLHSYDHWAWGGLTHVVPVAARYWMRRKWYDPWRVQAAGSAELTAAWQKANPGSSVGSEWIAGWIARAQQMTQLYGTPDRVGYEDLEAAVLRNLQLLRQCRLMAARLSRKWMLPLYYKLYPERWLESILGIKAPSAAIYMAFIQDITRFASVEQFRSWCGIVPTSHQSGTWESKGLHLTQAGPNLIKATLYLNANVARRWDAQVAALYHRQMVQYGKHHTQAVCACASHLASRIYTVLKEQRLYVLRDLAGKPISKEASRQLCQTTYRVPDEIRKRNTVRARRTKIAQQLEERWQHRPQA